MMPCNGSKWSDNQIAPFGGGSKHELGVGIIGSIREAAHIRQRRTSNDKRVGLEVAIVFRARRTRMHDSIRCFGRSGQNLGSAILQQRHGVRKAKGLADGSRILDRDEGSSKL